MMVKKRRGKCKESEEETRKKKERGSVEKLITGVGSSGWNGGWVGVDRRKRRNPKYRG
jgi:hypothetical protein